MAYQVLARKWRPQAFEDVIGQEHITDVLMNSIETGRIHHGYLFSGIRGIGKTTTARILAKALNCVNGPTPHPCNQCEFCKEVTEGYSIDVEEIDGASNRGVDEVRVLQENTDYAPSRNRYRIFIIDEVHMLTPQAFNALLKTLEEPPPNVVFMLATTEPGKIPMTILSRCQQFKFRNGSSEEVIQLLKNVALQEHITISDASLALLVKTSGGSIRDAENLLDQVIGFCGKDIPDGDVRYVLGIPDQDLLHSFLTAIFTHQAAHLFRLMDQLVSRGYNLRLFCMELMERIRNLSVLKAAQHPDAYLSLFDYTRSDLDRYALQTTLSELQQIYWILAKVEQDIKFSPNPRYILEMALTKMANVRAFAPFDDIYTQLQALQATLEKGLPQEMNREVEGATQVNKTLSSATSALPSQELLDIWDDVLKAVRQKRPPLAARIKNAIPVKLTQDEFTVGFHQDAQLAKESLEERKNAEILAEALYVHLGRTVRIVTTVHNGAMSPQAMREKLAQHTESLPRPEVRPREVKSREVKRSSSTQQRSGKSNWQKRPNKYKAPVQVSVQDIVKLFEGEIEE